MDLTQKEWIASKANTNAPVVLDVRTQEEFDAAHIPGAQVLDIQQPQQFMDGLSKLNPETHYFVYCRSGARSAKACKLLVQSGFKNVYNLLGGILEWQGPTE